MKAILSICLFLLPAFQPVYSQDIATLSLETEQSLLNDRLTLKFPAIARNESRQADVMAAGPDANNETRILMDIGNKRMVFFAEELFATGTDKLAEELQAIEAPSVRYQAKQGADGLLTVLVTPTRFDSAAEAIRIASLYLKTRNHTVVRVSAYINPAAFQEREACSRLAGRIFETREAGNRLPDLSARAATLDVYGGKNLAVTLPESYALSKSSSHDFEVFHLQKVNNIADTSWQSLTLYVGYHPSYFHRSYQFSDNEAISVAGTFLGKPVTWKDFSDQKRSVYIREEQIPSKELGVNLVVHIAMTGNTREGIHALQHIVEGIRLK